ncbi:unnamed protein product [Chondrus crispus]|uniref:Uncharacterized protein n=1 Tax=Chondrus crispus TaxID=2769 RepID=R7Q565_CHOCR|nr:unnamed protein product [Chondrus crispus]CDF33169.1 unnamed protein product [Chondrus crispus]|eukprot:XP_005712972.1 unnamed protein product [Chondrus crispus]
MPPATKRSRSRGGGAGGLEYISLDGLRIDGRRPTEVRKIRCSLGALSRADGSAYYEQGNTRVLVAVYGPREPHSRASIQHDRAVVKCEFSTAMFASPVYRRTWKGDRKSTAAALVMQKAFEGVILTASYPKSQIDIYVQVLQNDGGALVAAINAASLALVNAGVAMSDFVVACSVGFVDDTFVVDPSSLESASDRPELTLAVLSHSAKIASCQLDSKLPDGESFERALEFATSGANQIFKVLEYEVRKYSLNLLDSRGLVAL